jgi:hypothetical protein
MGDAQKLGQTAPADQEEGPVEILDFDKLRPLKRAGEGRRVRQPANLLFHPDGRIQISSQAVEWLWGKDNPFLTETEGEKSPDYGIPKALYLRMFVQGRPGGPPERLVFVEAEKGGEGTITANPVGRREIRWPVVYVARAARFVRELGIFGHVRYAVRQARVTKGGKEIRAIVADLTGRPMEGRRDDVYGCLEDWRERAQPGVPVSRDEFIRELKGIAKERGVPLTRRQVEEYVRLHYDSLRRRGFKFVLSGKTTFKEVVLRPSKAAASAARRRAAG